MKLKSIAYVAAGLIALGIVGTIWFKDNAKISSQKITIAQVGDFFLYAPIYIAKDAGFFEGQKLDVSIVSTGGDEKTWAAVISGSAQFGVGDPTFVAISDQRGQAGRVIASIVNGVPFWGITLNSQVPQLDNPGQLKGFSVATFPAPSTAYVLQAEMFRKAGLEPNIRQGAFGALIPMLKARQADIALELEPNVSTAVEAENARVVYSLAQIYGDFAITGLAASPIFLQNNADVARRMVCSLRKALDYIHTKPVETLDLLAKRFPELKSQVAASALKRVSSQNIIPRKVAIDPSAWQKAIALRVQAGDLTVAKAFNAYVDNQFADAADRDCRLN